MPTWRYYYSEVHTRSHTYMVGHLRDERYSKTKCGSRSIHLQTAVVCLSARALVFRSFLVCESSPVEARRGNRCIAAAVTKSLKERKSSLLQGGLRKLLLQRIDCVCSYRRYASGVAAAFAAQPAKGGASGLCLPTSRGPFGSLSRQAP